MMSVRFFEPSLRTEPRAGQHASQLLKNLSSSLHDSLGIALIESASWIKLVSACDAKLSLPRRCPTACTSRDYARRTSRRRGICPEIRTQHHNCCHHAPSSNVSIRLDDPCRPPAHPGDGTLRANACP